MRGCLYGTALIISIASQALAQNNPAQPASADAPPAASQLPRLPDVDVVAPAPQPLPSASQPPPVRAATLEDPRFDMSPFAPPPVTGYAAAGAVGGMLVDTPVLNLPQSIGVVPRALLDDQQLFSLSDAFRNVSGVRADFPGGNTTANGAEFGYLIRGFPTTYRRWNGYRSDLIQTSIDTGNIERIEFVKGPSAPLYGATDAGGFLNIWTKKPQQADFSSFRISSGSWGLARTDADINRRVSEDVAFRTHVGLQQADSFRHFVNDDRILVAPGIAAQLTERTQLLLEGEYYSTSTTYDTGVPRIGNSFKTLPIGTSINDPTDTAFGDYYKAAVTLRHELSDAWWAQCGFSFGSTAQHVQAHYPFDRVGAAVFQVPVYQLNNGRLPTFIAGTAGTIETTRATHHLAANFEAQWIATDTQSEFFFGSGRLLDPFQPIYAESFPASVAASTRQTRLDGRIVSLQDRVELNRYLELVGGFSFQDFHRTQVGGGGQLPEFADERFSACSPRGSVLLHPIPQRVSTWYSYTQSFFPQLLFFPSASGGTLPPTTGQQHEIGMRVMLNERCWASCAVFDLEKSAVPIPAGFTQIFAADARSQGIEFDLYGTLTERLHVTANYAYLDTRYTSDPTNAGIIGRQVYLVPHNMANGWLRYNLLDDHTTGRVPRRRVVGIGQGLRWTSSSTTLSYPSFVNFGGQSTLPGYVTMDLGLFGELGKWTANLYFENVTNAKYFTSGYGAFANPGNPFTIRTTIGVSF